MTPKTDSVSTTDNSQGKVIYEKIQKFLKLNETYKAGTKSSGTMSVAEAREILDLTINYEYSEHMTVCDSVSLDTLYIAMPHVDNNGNISTDDVIATYGTFETTLATYKAAIEDNRNTLSYFMIKFPTNDNAKTDSNIEIVFDRGIPSNDSLQQYQGPFEEGDDFYCGYMRGRCNSTFSENTDAANELTKRFKYIPNPPGEEYIMLLCNVEHVKYIAIPYNYNSFRPYVYYDDPNMEDCSDHWLFAKEMIGIQEFPCICHEEMNCYWRSIRRNIVLPNAPLHYSPIYNSPYNQCQIYFTDLYPKNNNYCTYVHIAIVRYCNVYWNNPNDVE